MNVLDYRILIWDHENYNQYFENSETIWRFIDFLLDSLKSNAVKIFCSKSFFDVIIEDNSIPLGKIHEYYPDLADIHSILLDKIPELLECTDIVEYEFEDNGLSLSPHSILRNHTHSVVYSIKKTFNRILEEDGIHIYISLDSISDCETIIISKNNISKSIKAYKTEDSIAEIINGLGRKYEKNEKHDPIRPHPEHNGDEVSVMSANEHSAQRLLTYARGIDNGSHKLYNFDEDNGSYVVFMPHRIEERLYHGYNLKNPSDLVLKLLGHQN